MKPAIHPKLLTNPVLQRVMKYALAIWDRFAGESVSAKTGRGHLKSAGVAELMVAKAEGKRRSR